MCADKARPADGIYRPGVLVPVSVAHSVMGRTVVCMSDKPDLNERFTLDPLTGEQVLTRLLDNDPTDDFEDDEPEAPEDEAT